MTAAVVGQSDPQINSGESLQYLSLLILTVSSDGTTCNVAAIIMPEVYEGSGL